MGIENEGSDFFSWKKLHLGVLNDHRNVSAILNYRYMCICLMCGIFKPNQNSKPEHIFQYTDTEKNIVI